MPEKILAALGGNALVKAGQQGTIQEQLANLDESLAPIVELIRRQHRLIITHGNGPQVGHILIRVQESHKKAYDLPLDVCVAQSQGEIGYMIQQRLHTLLHRLGIHRQVSTVVSQVVVDKNDPRMSNPTKPVGPFYDKKQALMMQDRGQVMVEDAQRGYRRVVPSPLPLRIVETETIRQLYEAGTIVIGAGGGGVPVREEDGSLMGIEAVVDKDWSASLLAEALDVEKILNVTAVSHAKLRFGSSEEQNLEWVTREEAKRYLAEGHFAPGSMEPKIEAALHFLEQGGQEVVITLPDKAIEAYEGRTGTHIYR